MLTTIWSANFPKSEPEFENFRVSPTRFSPLRHSNPSVLAALNLLNLLNPPTCPANNRSRPCTTKGIIADYVAGVSAKLWEICTSAPRSGISPSSCRVRINSRAHFPGCSAGGFHRLWSFHPLRSLRRRRRFSLRELRGGPPLSAAATAATFTGRVSRRFFRLFTVDEETGSMHYLMVRGMVETVVYGREIEKQPTIQSSNFSSNALKKFVNSLIFYNMSNNRSCKFTNYKLLLNTTLWTRDALVRRSVSKKNFQMGESNNYKIIRKHTHESR